MPRKTKTKTPSDYPYVPMRLSKELDARLTAVATQLRQSKSAVIRACMGAHMPKLEAASQIVKKT